MEHQSVLDRWFLRQDIINKLVAIGEDAESASSFGDRVLALASLEEAEFQTLTDPFDRSVALVFSLIDEEQFDAWNIDLELFLSEFTSRVKEHAESLDLPACGQLIRMSWEVLHHQSAILFDKIQYQDDEYQEDDLNMSWHDEYQDDEYLFTQSVLDGSGDEFLPQLFDGRIRRQEGRNVTLSELLAAFKDAAEDADLVKQRDEMRLLNQAELEQYLSNVGGRMHNEDLEGDIFRSWQAIRKSTANREKKVVTIDDVISHLSSEMGVQDEQTELEAKVSAFISGLFLTNRGFISITQSSESEPIYFEDLHPSVEEFDAIRELTEKMMDAASDIAGESKTGSELYLEKIAKRAEINRMKQEKRKLKEQQHDSKPLDSDSMLDEDWLVE